MCVYVCGGVYLSSHTFCLGESRLLKAAPCKCAVCVFFFLLRFDVSPVPFSPGSPWATCQPGLGAAEVLCAGRMSSPTFTPRVCTGRPGTPKDMLAPRFDSCPWAPVQGTGGCGTEPGPCTLWPPAALQTLGPNPISTPYPFPLRLPLTPSP